MRDYDPTIGRYLEPDPLGLVDGGSVYGYVGQNPGRYVDPRGECFGPLAFLLPACVGAVVGVVTGYLTDDDGCYTWGEGIWDAGVGAAVGGAARFAYYGYEIRFGGNVRIAPFGNRTGHPTGRWPHYHRPGGAPGQGVGRHRPWDRKSTDTSWWDRF